METKTPRLTRRDMLRHLVVLSGAVGAGASLTALSGCSRKLSCTDVTGLAPEDVNFRNATAGYIETAPDPTKKCNVCAQWVPAPAANACGGCKVVKGPINPDGWCKLFAPMTD